MLKHYQEEFANVLKSKDEMGEVGRAFYACRSDPSHIFHVIAAPAADTEGNLDSARISAGFVSRCC